MAEAARLEEEERAREGRPSSPDGTSKKFQHVKPRVMDYQQQQLDGRVQEQQPGHRSVSSSPPQLSSGLTDMGVDVVGNGVNKNEWAGKSADTENELERTEAELRRLELEVAREETEDRERKLQQQHMEHAGGADDVSLDDTY